LKAEKLGANRGAVKRTVVEPKGHGASNFAQRVVVGHLGEANDWGISCEKLEKEKSYRGARVGGDDFFWWKHARRKEIVSPLQKEPVSRI